MSLILSCEMSVIIKTACHCKSLAIGRGDTLSLMIKPIYRQ